MDTYPLAFCNSVTTTQYRIPIYTACEKQVTVLECCSVQLALLMLSASSQVLRYTNVPQRQNQVQNTKVHLNQLPVLLTGTRSFTKLTFN